MKSPTLLGVSLCADDRSTIIGQLNTWLEGSTFRHIATVNPEFLVEAHRNSSFRQLLNQTDLNVVDGTGITLWGRLLHGYRLRRITGVELAEKLCALASEQGQSVYFLGGFGVANLAAERMQKQCPNLTVAGFEDGSPTQLSDQLKQAQPGIILVAFGAPAQEMWIAQFKDQLPHTKIAVGIGGTFDFWAGKATRAPGWMRKIGLEWLWRLITEPVKRARRIWNAVFVFSWLVVKEKI